MRCSVFSGVLASYCMTLSSFSSSYISTLPRDARTAPHHPLLFGRLSSSPPQGFRFAITDMSAYHSHSPCSSTPTHLGPQTAVCSLPSIYSHPYNLPWRARGGRTVGASIGVRHGAQCAFTRHRAVMVWLSGARVMRGECRVRCIVWGYEGYLNERWHEKSVVGARRHCVAQRTCVSRVPI